MLLEGWKQSELKSSRNIRKSSVKWIHQGSHDSQKLMARDIPESLLASHSIRNTCQGHLPWNSVYESYKNKFNSGFSFEKGSQTYSFPSWLETIRNMVVIQSIVILICVLQSENSENSNAIQFYLSYFTFYKCKSD